MEWPPGHEPAGAHPVGQILQDVGRHGRVHRHIPDTGGQARHNPHDSLGLTRRLEDEEVAAAEPSLLQDRASHSYEVVQLPIADR